MPALARHSGSLCPGLPCAASDRDPHLFSVRGSHTLIIEVPEWKNEQISPQKSPDDPPIVVKSRVRMLDASGLLEPSPNAGLESLDDEVRAHLNVSVTRPGGGYEMDARSSGVKRWSAWAAAVGLGFGMVGASLTVSTAAVADTPDAPVLVAFDAPLCVATTDDDPSEARGPIENLRSVFGDRLNAYNEGEVVPLYDTFGANDEHALNGGYPPVCGTRYDGTVGVPFPSGCSAPTTLLWSAVASTLRVNLLTKTETYLRGLASCRATQSLTQIPRS